MKIGIDLVQISLFEKHIKNIDLQKVFTSDELRQNKNIESLAGIFASKEAFFKALSVKDEWQNVWIEKNKFGQPIISSNLLDKHQKAQVSISHDGDYAVAVVVISTGAIA
jgi:holo-[acyl-carrier protein] synthase